MLFILERSHGKFQIIHKFKEKGNYIFNLKLKEYENSFVLYTASSNFYENQLI